MTLFEILNAPSDAAPATVAFAVFCAERLIFCMPLALAVLWLWGSRTSKEAAVTATLAGLVALGIAQMFGLHYVPRPFAAGIGHTLIAHAPDSSFPSDHATVLSAVAVSLLLVSATRGVGVVLALIWIPMAWARVYVGVHFPSDVFGGAALGALTALAMQQVGGFLSNPLTSSLERLYSTLASPLIERGWVK